MSGFSALRLLAQLKQPGVELDDLVDALDVALEENGPRHPVGGEEFIGRRRHLINAGEAYDKELV